MSSSWAVTAPCLLDGVPDAIYHGNKQCPSEALSNSAMKDLVPPSTPAHFRWNRDHAHEANRAFDVGRAAHTRVLGVGEEMVACPEELLASNGAMTTKASKEWALVQRAEGRVPLTPSDFQMVVDLTNALAEHPLVEVLTRPGTRPEVSAYAVDPETGVWLRGRFDLAVDGSLWDFKTAQIAERSAFERNAWKYGYHRQAAMYSWLHELVTGETPPPMRFIVSEKTPPYLVAVFEPDPGLLELARLQIRAAIDLYASCVASGVWPGYPQDVQTLYAPRWAERELEAQIISGAADDLLDDLEGILHGN